MEKTITMPLREYVQLQKVHKAIDELKSNPKYGYLDGLYFIESLNEIDSTLVILPEHIAKELHTKQNTIESLKAIISKKDEKYRQLQNRNFFQRLFNII